jgi:diamine N-acetyltransferase
MSDLAPLPSTPLGRYRHYKGGEYEVTGVARHSEMLEPLVVYRPLYNDSGLWARPHAMFFGQVEVEGRVQPRFAPVESGTTVAGTALPAIDPASVTLREITAETVGPVVRLSVADSQKGFVAANAISLAQALFAPEAWYRAIYADDQLAGFVMLEDQSLRTPVPDKPGIGVWRLMIDAKIQGRGIGRAAMRRVIEHVRAKGQFDKLELSYVPGPGCPEHFYLGLGFRHTGRLDGNEVVLELPLRDAA